MFGVSDGLQRSTCRTHPPRPGPAQERRGKEDVRGVGFLLNGNLLVGVWNDSLCIWFGPEQAEKALPEPHVKEFDTDFERHRILVLRENADNAK